jgi:hypothetical protein
MPDPVEQNNQLMQDLVDTLDQIKSKKGGDTVQSESSETEGDHSISLPNQESLLKQKNLSPTKKHCATMDLHEQIPEDTIHPFLDLDTWSNKHQTLIVVETKESPPHEFVNRSTRLVTSLNTYDTIKADIVSLSDGLFYRGLVYTGLQPGGLSAQAIKEQAQKWGYNQCVIVTYCGGKQS